MTTNHTPTPWANVDKVICCERHAIADVVGFKNAEANAAFIVRACNAHDELVAALRGLLIAEKLDDDDPRLIAAREAASAALARVGK